MYPEPGELRPVYLSPALPEVPPLGMSPQIQVFYVLLFFKGYPGSFSSSSNKRRLYQMKNAQPNMKGDVFNFMLT